MPFITIEGVECSGKSTLLQNIKQKLAHYGITVFITREPGGVNVAEKIRELILDKNHAMQPWTEALLYIAARNEHFKKVINPLLNKNQIVLCDRFADSTLAYQGYARGLNIDYLSQVQALSLGPAKPDLTLFINIKYDDVQERMSTRQDAMNRLDLENANFHAKVYRGYQKIIEANPDRFQILDGRKPSLEIAAEACEIIINKFKLVKND